MTQTTTSTPNDRNLLERQLAAAQKRLNDKKAAAAGPPTVGDAPTKTTSDKVRTGGDAKKPEAERADSQSKIKSDREKREAEKAAKKAAEEAEKVARKAAKDKEKADKKADKKAAKEAEKAGGKQPAHMKKVERARSKLPKMDAATQAAYDLALEAGLSVPQLTTLAEHLAMQARVTQTMNAFSSKQLAMGDIVRIVGGDPKYLGLIGEVVHSHKLRAKVQVDGYEKPVYIYTGEAVPYDSDDDVEEETAEASAPDAPPAESNEPAAPSALDASASTETV